MRSHRKKGTPPTSQPACERRAGIQGQYATPIPRGSERPVESSSHLDLLEPYGADRSEFTEHDRASSDSDRVAAREELACDFDIVPYDYIGERAPNQITALELDELAILYSDIRLGHSNIKFHPAEVQPWMPLSDEEFQSAVLGDMRTLMRTSQGRGLLEDVAYQRSEEGGGRTTTFAWSSSSEQALMWPEMEEWENAANGMGVNTDIMYQPGVDLRPSHEAVANDAWAHMSSDIVLFHELVHADEYGSGNARIETDLFGTGPERIHVHEDSLVSPGDRGVNEDEYVAVGLGGLGQEFTENKYRAELDALDPNVDIPLRDSYNGSDAVDVRGQERD